MIITPIQMWKQTKNYREWRHYLKSVDSETSETLCNVVPGHPFATAGPMSVTDVKLHLSNTITNTESGKRVSQAVASTGRAVVGGITTAKGALSSWITSFKSAPPNNTDNATAAAADEQAHQSNDVITQSS